MDLSSSIKEFGKLIAGANHILMVQPNPLDTDSIASSLALKRIFEKLGKKTSAFSAKSIPESLRYIPGWEEFKAKLPKDFDAAVLVDGEPQRELVEDHKNIFSSKPFVHFDHHKTRPAFPFPVMEVVDSKASATGELVYQAAEELNWLIDKEIGELIGFSIMLDTVYFTTPSMRPRTFETLTAITHLGVDIADLFRQDMEVSGYDLDLLKYKAQLIDRIEIHAEGKIGFVVIPREEYEKYKDRLRPMDLIIYDIQRLKGVDLALVLTEQPDGIKGSMRANVPIAGKVAKYFNGGGHDAAAAFFVQNGNLEQVKKEVLEVIKSLI
ncbi:MAG: DHH family phosphoesterase [Patescibacteria group bacterium]|nr:DHH family phosphoesterase [Patescibacteria group bacterium]